MIYSKPHFVVLHLCMLVLLAGLSNLLPGTLAQAQTASALSNYNLGIEAYRLGDFRQAFDAWSLGAYEGDPEAQYNLGVLYLEGRGVERSAEQARSWFLQAAEKDHLEAQYNLGHMALSGMGIDKDPDAAMLWWRQAAEGGYAQAQFNYGRALYLGVGNLQDKSQGLAFIQKAAHQEDERASEFLQQNELADTANQAEIGTDISLEALLLATAEDTQRAPAAEYDKVKPLPLQQSTVVEELKLKQLVIEDHQVGKVKLNIVRDEPVVRRNYFMRTVDQPVPVFALADLSSQLEILPPGILVRVLAVEADNLKIEVISDLKVWVLQKDVQSEPGMASAVQAGRAMYLVPGQQQLGELPQKLTMKILKQRDDWLQLSLPQHIFGWIAARDLGYSGESSQQLKAAWALRLSLLDGYRPNTEIISLVETPPQFVQTDPLLNVKSPVVPVKVPVLPVTDEQSQTKLLPLDDNVWLYTQQDGSYVVHVFTLLDQPKAVRIANQTRYHAKAHLYSSVVKDRHWTYMLLGPYSDIDQAKAARDSLPRGLRKGARVRLLSLIAENRCKKRAILPASSAQGLDAYCL